MEEEVPRANSDKDLYSHTHRNELTIGFIKAGIKSITVPLTVQMSLLDWRAPKSVMRSQ